MQPDTIINELKGKLINLLMTSFPRTEMEPGFPQMLCDCCCLPVISYFQNDWLWHLFQPCTPHPLHLRIWSFPITLMTCYKLCSSWCRTLRGVLMMPFVFMVTFCFVTGEIHRKILCSSSRFWESSGSFSSSSVFFLSCPCSLDSQIPLLSLVLEYN